MQKTALMSGHDRKKHVPLKTIMIFRGTPVIRGVMMRMLPTALAAGGYLLAAGCMTLQNPLAPQSVNSSSMANCDECHPFPGSRLCRTDSVVSPIGAATECSACHSGSVQIDSMFTMATYTAIYHDLMLPGRDGPIPATGPSHADGSLTLDFTRCTTCHSYPPSSFGHQIHEEQGVECYQCHFLSIECDTETTGGGLYFFQHYRKVVGGDSLPVPDSHNHINNIVDVSFKKNFQRPYEYEFLFGFDRTTGICTNIQCHSGAEWGGASIERTPWRSE